MYAPVGRDDIFHPPCFDSLNPMNPTLMPLRNLCVLLIDTYETQRNAAASTGTSPLELESLENLII